MLSMTGFGKAKAESDELSVEVEIRTVNNRFLKCQIKCPGHLKEMESSIDAALRRRVFRGSVTVMLRVSHKGQGAGFSIDADMARSILSQAEALAKDLDQPAPTLKEILRLPGIITAVDAESDLMPEHKDLILQATDAALHELMSMRTTEGSALKEDLVGHLTALRELVSTISERAPVMVTAYAEKLTARLKERLKDLSEASEVTPSDIVREVALFTDRSDISEELQRLHGHLDQVVETLELEGEVGRRLDFLVQEIHREINTIGSKAQDAAISQAVVEAKTCAEKLREQVQNAE